MKHSKEENAARREWRDRAKARLSRAVGQSPDECRYKDIGAALGVPMSTLFLALASASDAELAVMEVALRSGTPLDEGQRRAAGFRARPSAANEKLRAVAVDDAPRDRYPPRPPVPKRDVTHHAHRACWVAVAYMSGDGGDAPRCIGPRCAAWLEADTPHPEGYCGALPPREDLGMWPPLMQRDARIYTDEEERR